MLSILGDVFTSYILWVRNSSSCFFQADCPKASVTMKHSLPDTCWSHRSEGWSFYPTTFLPKIRIIAVARVSYPYKTPGLWVLLNQILLFKAGNRGVIKVMSGDIQLHLTSLISSFLVLHEKILTRNPWSESSHTCFPNQTQVTAFHTEIVSCRVALWYFKVYHSFDALCSLQVKRKIAHRIKLLFKKSWASTKE